jgi:hypothetical protein
MSINLIDEKFKDEILNLVISSIFPNLNSNDKLILLRYIVTLINVISAVFVFNHNIEIKNLIIKNNDTIEFDEIYLYQLKQNDFQDIRWLISHLLPFINTSSDKTKLTSFNDIYVKKIKDVDINVDEPMYMFSNLQYNRCIRTKNNITERQFNIKDLEDNFYLLVETIKTMSNKMHVNWVDIIPFTITTYKESNLYSITREKIEFGSYDDWNPKSINMNINNNISPNLFIDFQGLQIEDIYNTISFDLFQSIKNIKWLIYDIPINFKYEPIIHILHKIFGLTDCLNNFDWENIDNMNFQIKWDNLLECANSGDSLTFVKDDVNTLSNESLKILLRGMILSFDKGASPKIRDAATKNTKKTYIPVPKSKEYLIKIGKLTVEEAKKFEEDEDDDEDDNEEKNKILSFENLYLSLKSLDPKFFYDFLSDSLQLFKNTWYGTKLLSANKTDFLHSTIYSEFVNFGDVMENSNNYEESLNDELNDLPLTYKNIYNFSKSFVSYVNNNNEFKQYPLNWKSLYKKDKQIIIDRLNSKNPDDRWFNIAKHIRTLKLLKNYSTTNEEINKKILIKITNLITDVIFETLIFKGVLTKFVPDKTKSNKQFVDIDDVHKLQKKIFDESENNEYWNGSYHFLTNVPYSQMKKFDVEVNNVTQSHNYFSYGKTKDGDWYLIDAYNWVAQIGFCHHYLNNRVQFITGATGVGKSTEIPKLFLYYSKAIGFIQNPKIICSQPRIGPVSKSAERISTCLGLPIKSGNTETQNYYIQTKYSSQESSQSADLITLGSHHKNVFHAMLQFITDGTLILEALNPTMKTKKSNGDFTDFNMYDIIMIDESHEHKINMDLLLTLFRHALTYNNTLKLVILSATMDNDEYKYRRYYRNINDNKIFPLNMWISENSIDRISVDRRYHISPPNVTTRYVVKHFYRPTTNKDLTQDIKNILDEILKSYPNFGDILIFEASSKKINKLVDELNKFLPYDCIALPFYSKLNADNDFKKQFVEDINKNLKLIKMDKNINFSDPNVTLNFITTGQFTYKRAIIVATNIAEASITIPTLKFVIDTGTQIIKLYDYFRRTEIQKIIKISEASRIQRAGRVGRKSSGYVYYLYEKGELEKNIVEYEISTENLFMILFGKLKETENENIMVNKKLDTNSSFAILEYDKVDDGFIKLSSMIKKQYFIKNNFYSYFGDMTMYDYENYEQLSNFYDTGFDLQTLTDKNGSFYLIHPNEIDINRNICGHITSISPNAKGLEFVKNKFNDRNNFVISKKISSFWQMLLDYLYVSFNSNATTLIKTKLGIEIVKLFESLKLDSSFHGLVRMIVMSLGISCKNDVLKLVSFYILTSYETVLISKPTKSKTGRDQHKFNKINKKSESVVILDILNNLHEWLENNEIAENLEKLNLKYLSNFETQTRYKLTSSEMLLLVGPKENYTDSLNNKISDYKKNDVIELFEIELFGLHKKILLNKLDLLKKYCDVHNINFKLISTYINKYFTLQLKINKFMTLELKHVIDNIKVNFDKIVLTTERKIDKLELCLLFGFPLNICKKMNNSIYYLSMYNPKLSNMYSINSTSLFKYKPNTIITDININNYVLFLTTKLNEETDDNNLTCIHNITPELFTIMRNIYSENNYKKIIKNINIPTEITDFYKNTYYNTYDNTLNINNAILSYTKILKTIQNDIFIHKNLSYVNFIKNIDINISVLF